MDYFIHFKEQSNDKLFVYAWSENDKAERKSKEIWPSVPVDYAPEIAQCYHTGEFVQNGDNLAVPIVENGKVTDILWFVTE